MNKVHIENRKKEIENQIKSFEQWQENLKPSIPHLFDSKTAFLDELSSLPLNLEKQIADKSYNSADLKLGRYKAILIPLGSHLSNKAISELLQFFLSFSQLPVVKDASNSKADA